MRDEILDELVGVLGLLLAQRADPRLDAFQRFLDRDAERGRERGHVLGAEQHHRDALPDLDVGDLLEVREGAGDRLVHALGADQVLGNVAEVHVAQGLVGFAPALADVVEVVREDLDALAHGFGGDAELFAQRLVLADRLDPHAGVARRPAERLGFLRPGAERGRHAGNRQAGGEPEPAHLGQRRDELVERLFRRAQRLVEAVEVLLHRLAGGRAGLGGAVELRVELVERAGELVGDLCDEAHTLVSHRDLPGAGVAA